MKKLFHMVLVGCVVFYKGEPVIKVGPKRAMTTRGKVITIADSETVTV